MFMMETPFRTLADTHGSGSGAIVDCLKFKDSGDQSDDAKAQSAARAEAAYP